MKRFFILSFILLLIPFIIYYYLTSTSTTLTPEESAFIKDKTVVFVSQLEYPPFEFIAPHGEQTGMAVEIARWIGTEFGFKARFVNTSFHKAQEMILKGDADVLTSFFYSVERDKYFDFTQTVFVIPASIFVKIDNVDIKGIKDLNGKKVAIQKGDYAIDFLKKQGIDFKLVATESFIRATEALLSGEVDVMLGDEQIVLYYLHSINAFSKVKIIGTPLYEGLCSMSVKDGNKTLLSVINKGIQLAKKKGIISSIQRKWLNSKVEPSYYTYLPYLITISVILLISIILVWIWNILLKRKIKEKTNALEETLLKLGNSEKKFRGFFEQSSTPYLLLDKNGFIDCNMAAISMLRGRDKADLLLHPAQLSPEYQPDGELSSEKAKKIIDSVFETKESKSFEWLHKRLDGESFWAFVNLCIVPYDGREIIFTTWADISELKKLQQIILDDKENLEVTLKSIGDGVIKVDANTKIQMMNSVAEKLTGWSYQEAQGKPLSDVFVIEDVDTGQAILNPVMEVLNSGKVVELSSNAVLVSKNMNRYDIFDSASPIKDKSGNIIGVVLVFRDVTEKNKQDRELLKSEKLRSLGVLAGGIAHDFNNLLTSIYGYISLSKSMLPEDSKAHTLISKAEQSIDNATKLTKQLLTFSKGGEPILENVDLKILIKEVVKFNLSGKNVKPFFDISDELYDINADRGQLSQVLSNLTINAVQAMKDGRNIYIKVSNIDNPSEELKGSFIKIEFKDQGEGIPPSLIDKIFDPYFTTKSSGTGLGLSIVYSIVKKHGGKIFVKSDVGKGTEFTIYLPASKGLVKGNANIIKDEDTTYISNEESGVKPYFEKQFPLKQNKDDKNSSNYKILLLDDEKDVLSTLKDMLEALSNRVEGYTTSEEAIQSYREAFERGDKFDIVILDLILPGDIGGKEVMEKLIEIDPDVRAIVSSGYSDNEVLANYQKYGFKGKLAKPYLIQKLKAEINRVAYI